MPKERFDSAADLINIERGWAAKDDNIIHDSIILAGSAGT